MKKWWKSKTLWANGLAGLAVMIQAATGTAWFDAELQAAVIVVVNTILRIVTSEGLAA